MSIAIVIIVVAVIATISYLRQRYLKKRRDEFRLWVEGRGWTYTREDDSFTDRFFGTPFNEGDDKEATNVVQGTHDDRPFVAFDYKYETESTDSNGNRTTETHRFGIVSMGMPAQFPTLQVSKESLFSSLARAVGFHDIELENEDFNKKFNVSCKDKKFAYDVLHPRMMAMLLDTPGPGWRLERSDLVGWEKGRISAESIDRNLKYLTGVIGWIPRFVWQDAGVQPPANAT